MSRLISAAAAALVAAACATAQESESVAFEGATWTAQTYGAGAVRVEEFLGRDALFVSRANAVREDIDLADMVLEYDYASTHASGFIGVDFRASGDNLEQFYTRPHQSGQPDATQYMVMINGVATWQIHAGPNDATAVDLPAREWIKVRIVAIGDQADIFVGDMETPLLHVPNLRFDGGRGAVALYASDRPWMTDTGAYFSNIVIREATADDEIIGEPRDVDPLPDGLISTLQVSDPFSESDVATAFALDDDMTAGRTWTALSVEDNGVGNLARVASLSQEANTVFVRLTIDAEEATARLMKFGYSDRVRLYVNGEAVFSGNAQWRSRDHRFLGTVNFEDAIALHLNEGRNEVIAAVSESFGGWAFAAAIADQDGLTIN